MALKTLTFSESTAIPRPTSWEDGKAIHVTGYAPGGSGGCAGGKLAPAGGGGAGEYFEGVLIVDGSQPDLTITIPEPGAGVTVEGPGEKGGDLVMSGALSLTLKGGGRGAGPGSPDGGEGGNGGGSADDPQPAQHALILDTADPDHLTVMRALRLESPQDFSTATEVAYSGILGGVLTSIIHVRAAGPYLFVMGMRPNGAGVSRAHLLRFPLAGVSDLSELGALDQVADVSAKFTANTNPVTGFDLSPDGTRLWVVYDGASSNNNTVRQFDLSAPWDIAGAWSNLGGVTIFDSVSLQPSKVMISDDGLILYLMQSSTLWALWDLPTAWNIIGMTLRRDVNTVITSSVVGGNTVVHPQFTRDGTHIIGWQSDATANTWIAEVYALSTPWDETTRTFVNTFTLDANISNQWPGFLGSPDLSGDFYFGSAGNVAGGVGADSLVTDLKVFRIPALDFLTETGPITSAEEATLGTPFTNLVAAKYTKDGRHIWLYDDTSDRLIILDLTVPFRPDMVNKVTVSDFEDFTGTVLNLREIIIGDDETSAFLIAGTTTLTIHKIILLNGPNDARRVSFSATSTLSGFSSLISAGIQVSDERFFIADWSATAFSRIREVNGPVGGTLVVNGSTGQRIDLDPTFTSAFESTGLALSEDGTFLHVLISTTNSIRTYRLNTPNTLVGGAVLVRDDPLPDLLLGATSLDLSDVILSSGIAAGGGAGAGSKGGDGVSSPTGFSRAGGPGTQHAGGDARGPNSLQAGHGGIGKNGCAGGGGAITANGTKGRGQDGGTDGSTSGISADAVRGSGSGAGFLGSGKGGSGKLTLLFDE
ncbi:hypothetical protein JCM17846_18560 [Iodidimonas nitroreducens]|uniref:Glycine-rich domain-containing protein n=1 Tax=Iodidimonas nitroreducens TaxID=1236968 RepID=A0A5A7N8T6_9PROT|nr:hypothetical protein [Iodidimonas nitroreducens]GAK33247.1 gluconolactonase [alpha proteobacterium Q-1]GER04174.1 hypothetical protein JCM17846_18560 [Iodidimonas nitroreducens]